MPRRPRLTPATRHAVIALATLLGMAGRGAAEVPDTLYAMDTPLAVETVAEGLSFPWSIARLPGGDMLVTEKNPPALRRVSPDGTISAPLPGLPAIVAEENGGLLGLALDPAFAQNARLYLAFSEPGPAGTAGLSVFRARLAGDRLADGEVIFRQSPKLPDARNFGGRLLFAPDGTLLVLAGDRFAHEHIEGRDPLGPPMDTLGVVARVRPDGTVPADNPFADGPAAGAAVFSRGHRNPGGAAFHPETGRLFLAEFGPWGGDELILPEPGGNYGWPATSWGRPYAGGDIPDPPTRPEFDREIFFWSPTIGPGGMAFYEGELIPGWDGSLLVGGLTSRSLVRLTVEGERVLSEERLPVGVRVRDVTVTPDGAILLLTDEAEGRILRLSPPADESGGETE